MKIGYACINYSLECTANKKFKLSNYSKDKMLEYSKNNLECLNNIIDYNINNNLMFFRISSETIPFASHPICDADWKAELKQILKKIGKKIISSKIRISMHPDQFVLINSPDEKIVKRSIKELEYHADLLDLMELDTSAKIQIHVGGVYGDKESAIKRFIENYNKLPDKIKKRLVIENDDKSYPLKDCLYINSITKIPIIFDIFHHKILNNGENEIDALKLASKTWKEKDGVLMIDYSSQEPNAIKGKHISSIDESDFKSFTGLLNKSGINCDIMLEIKDKENSALKAKKYINLN